jgi:hypothetical protein
MVCRSLSSKFGVVTQPGNGENRPVSDTQERLNTADAGGAPATEPFNLIVMSHHEELDIVDEAHRH